MVIAPANTGKDNNNNQAVINTLHTNKVRVSKLIPGVLILLIIMKIPVVNTMQYESRN
jgi:hypothetical protein